MFPSSGVRLFMKNNHVKDILTRCFNCKYSHSLSKTNSYVVGKTLRYSINGNVFNVSERNYLRNFSSGVGVDGHKQIDSITENVSDESGSFVVDEQAVTQGDPDKLKQLKVLMLEVDVYRQEALYVPKNLSTEQWIELLQCRNRSQKLKRLKFWTITEYKKQNDKLRKVRKRNERLKKLEEVAANTVEEGHIRYGLGGNTIFQRITETTMNKLANSRLVTAMQFGQDLIIDCSYEQNMTKREQGYCAKQLMLTFAMNRMDVEPFNIHYCNINRESHMVQTLNKFIPNMYDDDLPMNVHEKHYLEMFPKEKLVYLTPHCRNELLKFNHDDIYIIGGIVDKVNNEPLSLAKAKSEGLRMAKFPLDRYLVWGLGGKSLTLDQCINILLEIKRSGNWELAFKHVPRRKLVREITEEEMEEAESERDKRPHFGQTYVASHEWGIDKKKAKRAANRVHELDLRAWLAAKKHKIQ